MRTLKKSLKWHMHLVAVALHQLEAVQTIRLQLRHLSDPRLVRSGEILMSDPRDSRTLAQLCKRDWGRESVRSKDCSNNGSE